MHTVKQGDRWTAASTPPVVGAFDDSARDFCMGCFETHTRVGWVLPARSLTHRAARAAVAVSMSSKRLRFPTPPCNGTGQAKACADCAGLVRLLVCATAHSHHCLTPAPPSRTRAGQQLLRAAARCCAGTTAPSSKRASEHDHGDDRVRHLCCLGIMEASTAALTSPGLADEQDLLALASREGVGAQVHLAVPSPEPQLPPAIEGLGLLARPGARFQDGAQHKSCMPCVRTGHRVCALLRGY